MKNIILAFLLLLTNLVCAQDDADNLHLAKPTDGKFIVYFVRRSHEVLLVKYNIYDSNIPLGKLGAQKYFAYECEPGEHIFVAKSENTSYMEAGRVYVVDVETEMGLIKARVNPFP